MSFIENIQQRSIEELNELSGLFISRHDRLQLDYPDVDRDEIRVLRYTAVDPAKIKASELNLASLGDNMEQLTAARAYAVEQAMRYYEEAQKAMDNAAKAILGAKVINELIRRQKIKPLEHTHNTWKLTDQWNDGETGVISNAVYRMYYHIYADKDYRNNTVKSYHLTWDVVVRSANPNHKSEYIAGQDRKLFKSKDELVSYLAGRKKRYASYFQEDFPPVPSEYKHLFTYGGSLLPGYKLAELKKGEHYDR